MSTTEHVPMVATRADRPAPMNRLPIDGSTLETRLAGDHLGVSELIKMLFAALMLESSNRCYELMQECGDLFHHATESDLLIMKGLLRKCASCTGSSTRWTSTTTGLTW